MILFFLLMSLAKGLSMFTFSKKQLFVSLIFSIAFFFFLASISFVSALISMISSFLLTLGIVSSFSSCFRYKVRQLFKIFLFPWGKLVLLLSFLFKLLLLSPIGFGSSSFHFCLSLDYLFPLWFIQWSISCLVAYCLASTFFFRFFLVAGFLPHSTVVGKDV